MKEEKATTEEKPKEEIEKETVFVHRDKFRCKKCTNLKFQRDARVMIVMQTNKPLDMPHIRFQTKAEVTICRECYEAMKRS